MINEMNIDQLLSRFFSGTLNKRENDLLMQYIANRTSQPSKDPIDKEIEAFLADRELLEFKQNIARICEKNRNKPREKRFYLPGWLMAASLLLLVATGATIFLMLDVLPIRIWPNGLYTLMDHSNENANNSEKSFGLWSPDWEHRGILISRHEFLNQRPEDMVEENRFTPYPYMESLVGIVMRSGQNGLKLPPYELKLYKGEPIIFQWENNIPDQATIEVTDNKGACLLSVFVSHDSETRIATKDWNTGVYYWRLLVQDQLVTVGKVLINQKSK
jgi:hypothetical protein